MATTLTRIILGISLGVFLFGGTSLWAERAEGEEDTEGGDMVMTQQGAIIAD